MTEIDFALNPDLTRGRALSDREQLQRSHAMCRATGDPRTPSCSGSLFVGLFFDGTGNNEDEDYKKHEQDPRHQKHSNVVRLYHAYPDRKKVGTNAYYAYYIPGVGTPFREIGDDGGKFGSAAAWGGEPRIIWGLTRIFNAVHRYQRGDDLIPDDQAKAMTSGLGGVGSSGWQRRWALKQTWQDRLKAAIRGRKPQILQINLSVFGFSRGAAEARAFVNWLYEICEKVDGGWRFAGIPLHVQFLGIFDTVASVGIAGLYSFAEGRQSWADDNMQVHPAVEQCLHLVAGHEVRACFPSDSVRINGKYPPNCKEFVFPGSHSDIGGGYMPLCLGKADWNAVGPHHDLQLARVPGFEMYRAALVAGVPFYTEQQLIEKGQKKVFDALTPSQSAVDAVKAYYLAANIKAGTLEDMTRQHMRWYFSHRWQLLEAGFRGSPQYQRACGKPNHDQGDDFKDEPTWLLHTQRALIQVVAESCRKLEWRMRVNNWEAEREGEVLDSPFRPAPGARLLKFARSRPLVDDSLQAEAGAIARQAPAVLARWREWLSQNMYPEVHDAQAPERDMTRLLEVLQDGAVPQAIASFLDAHVHDSMAGFIGFGMPEFQTNGYGIAKFRRIYFGNAGDKIVRDQVARDNERRISEARGKRNQAEAERMPPRMPPMSEWFPRLN
ncbi:DUF2235 domain-containing protein [Cupriavidus sp. 2MCAB6]|uniref:T6SS phospholipase effector Tle1-like catalytic domain-containing protein n=1 Tax=Cupriavidus sp. 2MCAB6 TaxID=3232981 RepID=UPI003F930715